jgi:predicted nicotinamide N-methyase
MDSLDYQLTTRPETVGDLHLWLTGLVDFEATVDDICRRQDSAAARRWLDDLCPMFGVIWPVARALAAELAAEGRALRGLRTLELGCGLAMPSMIAAKAGAHPTATDLHPDARTFLLRNLAQNGLGAIPFAALDWRDPAASGLPPATWDRVIASDVLYQRTHPPLVADMFAYFLAPDGVGLLTDPGRPHLQAFADAAEARGLSVDLDVRAARSNDGGAQDVFLLTLRRAARPGLPGAAGG